jgi:thiamine biosynthesis protein ThiI
LRPDIILARYGEIGLKSPPVRRRFEQTLQSNIEQAFEQEGLDCVIRRLWGRLLVSSSDIDRATPILRKIFGLTSVSPAVVRSSKLDALLPAIGEYYAEQFAQKPTARSFAIRARRSGSHPYSSQDVAKQGGGAVLSHPKGQHLKVDLEDPDIEIFVEVRDDKAYLFSQTVRGPGGLPMGSQGRVLVMLKDLHSLVAAWLMLKRGCTIVPVHFDGITGNRDRAEQFRAFLRAWYVRAELIHVPHQETNEFPRDATCALCMRQMVRKCALLARYKKCKAIVTGEAFSSTTVDNLTLFGGLTNIPILRPILGTTPEMVNDFLTAMGLEASKTVPFFEPCPLRTKGRVAEDRLHVLEQELGVEARAHAAVRERDRPVRVGV